MADTTVNANVHTAANNRTGLWGPFWISPTTAVIVYTDDAGDVEYIRCTDGDPSGETPTEITSDEAVKLCVYADWQTPEFDDGNLVHCWWIEAANGQLQYRTIDLSDGSLGTERAVATLANGETAVQTTTRLTGCKLRNGRLMVVGRVDATTDTAFGYYSDDAGATWNALAAVPFEEVPEDTGYLFPANTADANDAALVYSDRSADEISVKMWDDSAGTWTETSVRTTVDVGALDAEAWWHASLRHSDGVIVVVAWTLATGAAADIVTSTVNPNSVAAPGVASTTSVVTATTGGCVHVTINQQNDDVYVAYGVGTNGATLDIVYKVSTDDLSTWGTQTAYSEDAADDYRRISGPTSITSRGGLVQFSWFDDDDNDLFVNLVNDIEIAASGGASATRPAGINRGLINNGLINGGLIR